MNEYPPTPLNATYWERLKLKFHRSLLISETHPKTMENFKSELAILQEKKRHYENYKYSIHPFSKFNRHYEIWCFFFYGIMLFAKTLDFALVTINVQSPLRNNPEILLTILALDTVSVLNICFQFCIGYEYENTKVIELSKGKIILKYVVSGHFFCDLFSAIPRILAYRATASIYLFALSLTLLKLRRVTTFIHLIKPTALFFGIKSSTKVFLFGFFFLVALTFHMMACLHMGVPRFRISILKGWTPESLVNRDFDLLPWFRRYMISFFRTSQYTFLIDLSKINKNNITEEVIICLTNYFVGKALMTVIWIVLLYTLMSRRMLKLKFEEIMTELNEYMHAKQLPVDLKKRLLSYYTYKYQKVFFNESNIRTILSQHLKQEIDVFLCNSLIKKVSIFAKIPSNIMPNIIAHLIPQIYLPNDLIIQSATYGDCMYFIESGSVAVFTPSGKEICHLQDGAYFGEIAILMKGQKRTASVIAIEITRVYKLTKEQFDRCLKSNEQVYNDLLSSATKRIEETQEVDFNYKKILFEQIYTNRSNTRDKNQM